METVILTEYIKECKDGNKLPSVEGLYKFKALWKF